MRIGGFIPTTMLDYPGKLACTVFVQGCNLRCPFCQNGALVLPEYFEEALDSNDVIKRIEKRRKILEGVCISGGEPTLQNDLPDFIAQLKAIGLPVKLDTNGSQPNLLKSLIENELIDYVAMDVKAAPANYPRVCGINAEADSFISPYQESIEILLHSDIDYEFRTTLVKGLHEPSEIKEIAELLKSTKVWYLQSYTENERVLDKLTNADESGFNTFSRKELEDMLSVARKIVPNAQLREA